MQGIALVSPLVAGLFCRMGMSGGGSLAGGGTGISGSDGGFGGECQIPL